MAYTWLAALRSAGGVEMPPAHSMPTPHQLWQAGLASPLRKPLRTVLRHDLRSGSDLGERVLHRWTKPTLCTGFFLVAIKLRSGRETWAIS